MFQYSSCIKSVSAQHCRFFASQQHYTCPWTAFLEDLGQFISVKHARGDAIILLADMNGDIHHPTLLTFAAMHHLQELLLQKFPDLPLPSTFCRGGHSGKVPIDGAWATNDLTINAISWQDIPSSPGDHCAVVLDLNLLDCIGEPRYSTARPPGRRLNCYLPGTPSQYLSALTRYTEAHHLSHRLNQLFLLTQSASTSSERLLATLEKFNKLKRMV